MNQPHSLLKNKEGSLSAFSSPKLKKQVSIKHEHVQIGSDKVLENEYVGSNMSNRRKSQNLENTGE